MVGARYGKVALVLPDLALEYILDDQVVVDERHRRRPFENFCHRETRKDELRRADARNKPDK